MDELSVSYEELDAFIDRLTPQTRQYVLEWFVLPWMIGEMLVGKPEGASVLQELMDLGVIRFLNTVPELYLCDAKRR